jgi:tetratricopeptide (TPR) repeat protein
MLRLFSFLLTLICICGAADEIEFYTQGLKNNPENPDLLFRLAQAYEAAYQYPKAIQFYLERVKKEGEKEQMWQSRYRLGLCYEKLNDWQNAMDNYLEAHQIDPNRPDPLLNISIHYRTSGKNDLAYLFAKHGSRLFQSNDYHFDEELSIVSYYTRFKEDGYKAASDLLLRKDAPWNVKYQTYQNILFYTQNLKGAHFRPIECELPLIAEGSELRYFPMNPSILKTENGYQVICRSVNYTQKGAKEFETIDPRGLFNTRNFLLEYDKEFHLLAQNEIIENLVRERLASCNVLGLEDPRIFAFQGSTWFTCTTRDNTSDGIPRISLCKMRSGGEVESMVLLEGPDPVRCEKNWLPFIKDETLHIIYSYDPFIVLQPDLETGECKLDLSYEPAWDLTQFRGSAGPIPFDNGYLILIHEVVQFGDFSRCYLHRFVYTDHRFFVKKISKPFTFLHQGVEFCGSMTLNHEGTFLILAIGIEDSKAYLCSVDLKTIRSQLAPL